MSVFDQAKLLVHLPKDRSLLTIAATVVIGHVLLLLWSVLTHSEARPVPPSPQRRLVVQTVNLNPGRSAPKALVALRDPEPVEKKTQPEVVEEAIVPTATPKESPVEIKAEIAPPIEEPQPVAPIPPAPIRLEPPAKSPPVKLVEQAPPKIKAVPKKPDASKKKEEIEKTAVKKSVVKNQATPKKTEVKKKDTAVVKSPEKKVEAAKTSPKDKPKKVEVDKAAVERQKKIAAEQQAAKARQQKLLSQAQETIAKIDKSRDKVSRTNLSGSFIASPGAISSLQIDSLPDFGGRQQLSSQEASYRDELAGRLKLLLKLPEYGEVKIKLILERSGKVAKVVVVSAASTANRKYIEKTLQTLTFPAFGANFDQASQFTFSITLCNDL